MNFLGLFEKVNRHVYAGIPVDIIYCIWIFGRCLTWSSPKPPLKSPQSGNKSSHELMELVEGMTETGIGQYQWKFSQWREVKRD